MVRSCLELGEWDRGIRVTPCDICGCVVGICVYCVFLWVARGSWWKLPTGASGEGRFHPPRVRSEDVGVFPDDGWPGVW